MSSKNENSENCNHPSTTEAVIRVAMIGAVIGASTMAGSMAYTAAHNKVRNLWIDRKRKKNIHIVK